MRRAGCDFPLVWLGAAVVRAAAGMAESEEGRGSGCDTGRQRAAAGGGFHRVDVGADFGSCLIAGGRVLLEGAEDDFIEADVDLHALAGWRPGTARREPVSRA